MIYKNTEDIVCLNQFLALCPHCKKDVDTNHHPNNFDCPRFRAVKLIAVSATKDNGTAVTVPFNY